MKRIFTNFVFIFLMLPFLGAQSIETSQIHWEGYEPNLLKAGSCPAGSLLSNPSNGGWALTSSIDQGSINYLRFDNTMLHESTEVDGFVLWGLQAFNAAGSWSECLSDEMDFLVKFYEDDNGEPGNVIFEEVVTAATIPDPDVAFGTWTVKKFSINLSESVPFYEGFISLASTNSPTCWYLGINVEDTGLNNSYIYDEGGNFVPRTVTPQGGDPYVTGIGFCLLGTDDYTSVVDIIAGSPDHATLATAVTVAGLIDVLSDMGSSFTVFAPTDEAFDALPEGLLGDLLDDPEGALTKVLLYHVVDGSVLSGDLSDGQVITTLLGQELTVSIVGEDVFIVDVFDNASQVIAADLEADNGVVHVVDAVLIPEILPATVVEIIVDSPDHTTLATAVTEANLVDALSAEGPFTVFAPTNAAFDALPEGLLGDLLADPEGALTLVLLYHVVDGKVMSGDLSDGQVITTLSGQELTVSIVGDDVFIVDVFANASQVIAADLEADNGVVHVVDAVLIPELPDDTFSVTFNVDMTNVEGFDPLQHDVYIAGTFGEGMHWNEPGTNPDLKMEPTFVVETPPFTLYENWQSYDDFTTDVSPWLVHHINDNVTFNASDFNFPGEGTAFAWMVFNPSQTDPAINDNHPSVDGDKYLIAVQSQTPNDNKWLITPEVSFDATSVFSFSAKSITAQYGNERIRVLVSTTGWETDDFTLISEGDHIEVPTDWTEYEFELDQFAGQTGHIAIQYVSHDAFIFMLDAISLDAEVDGEDTKDQEEYIYTITLNLEEGEVQYKYASTVNGEGWQGEEWPGDPNRVINVTEAMTVNDVFGEQPVSVVENELAEQGFNLFPNPVRNTLYVENSEIINNLKIFDLTGRLVLSQVVNDNNVSINVSTLKTGVYIMQVMTVEGVVSKKFNVQ